jgi:hypothetical protein
LKLNIIKIIRYLLPFMNYSHDYQVSIIMTVDDPVLTAGQFPVVCGQPFDRTSDGRKFQRTFDFSVDTRCIGFCLVNAPPVRRL